MTFTLSEYEKIYNGNLEWLVPNTVFLTKYGSQAYNLATPESDLDIRGITIPPAKYFLGYSHTFEQAEIKNEIDGVIYNIQKFFRLAADANPSIIEQLFVDESDIIHVTPEGEKILAIRDSFLSKKIKFTFGGYAYSQLKRVIAHKRWLENAPRKPTRAEHGLPEQNVLSAEIRGAAEKLEIVFSDNVMELLQREKAYAAACREYDNYKGWVKNRNAKRAEIERKIGYDGKHVSQLIRLYLMAGEILSTGKVNVKRPIEEREWLVGIKTGRTDWTYEKVIEFVENKSQELDKLYEISILPHTPNHNFLNQSLQDIISKFLFR